VEKGGQSYQGVVNLYTGLLIKNKEGGNNNKGDENEVRLYPQTKLPLDLTLDAREQFGLGKARLNIYKSAAADRVKASLFLKTQKRAPQKFDIKFSIQSPYHSLEFEKIYKLQL